MPERRTRSFGFALRVALAIVAMAVETLIPLVVAGDIAAVQANALPVCSAAGHASLPADDSGKHRPAGTSPICAALAAAAAMTTPAAIPLPAPLGWRLIRPPVLASAGSFRAAPLSYDARGPPLPS